MTSGRRLATAALLALLSACSTFGSEGSLEVESVVARAGYLDVWLSGHGIRMRSFAVDDPTCGRVLARGKEVGYLERGIGGRFHRGEERCDAVGIGDPRMQRSNMPRSTGGGGVIPRGQAVFQTLYEDEEVLMLRGRFPLSNRVGWGGGVDSVALVANDGTCRAAIQGGVASIEFRASGRNTLALVAPSGLCRIEGLLLPPANAPAD